MTEYSFEDYYIDICGLTTLLDPRYDNSVNKLLANYPGQAEQFHITRIKDTICRIERYVINSKAKEYLTQYVKYDK